MIALFERWFKSDKGKVLDDDVDTMVGAAGNDDDVADDHVVLGPYELPALPHVWYGVSGDYVIAYHGGSSMLMTAIAHPRGESMLVDELGKTFNPGNDGHEPSDERPGIVLTIDNHGSTGPSVVRTVRTDPVAYRLAEYTINDCPVVTMDNGTLLTGTEGDTWTVFARISPEATMEDIDAYAEILRGTHVDKSRTALFPGDTVPITTGENDTVDTPIIPLENVHGNMDITIKADGTVSVDDDNGRNELVTNILQTILDRNNPDK